VAVRSKDGTSLGIYIRRRSSIYRTKGSNANGHDGAE
jgi:hypothetical protein